MGFVRVSLGQAYAQINKPQLIDFVRKPKDAEVPLLHSNEFREKVH